MSSHSGYGVHTDASVVASAFSSQIEGKTIIITGVNLGGIGYTTAEAFAAQGPRLLVFTGRSPAKVNAVIEKLRSKYPKVPYRFLHMDLSSQKSVRKAAEEVAADDDIPQINILINNAGVMDEQPRQLSEDGIEMHFAINHIGHFLFTNLILSKIIASAKTSTPGATRIVNISSSAHIFSPIRFSDINFDKPKEELPESELPNYAAMQHLGMNTEGVYNSVLAYGQSKVANILFSLSLTHRLFKSYGIASFAVHPGSIPTELQRNADEERANKLNEFRRKFKVVRKTLTQGSSTSMVAALDPALTAKATGDHVEGVYLSDCQFAEPSAWAKDPAAAEKLWALSEQLIGEKFD